MTITELLEEDKDGLLGRLERAGTPERGETVLSEELQKLLVRYNQSEDSGLRRSAAAGMTEALQSGLALLDTRGETRVWESEPQRVKRSVSAPGIAFLAAGCALAAAALVILLDRGAPVALALLPVLGGFLTGLGGFLLRPGTAAKTAPPERKVEVATDWNKVYRVLHTAGMVMDRNLSETVAALPDGAEPAGEAPERSELELLGSLLEAARSGDGEFALDRLDQVRHYLHSRGIDTVEYAPETADWFDLMPSVRRETLRPALVRDGELLLRGLAAEGR
ncbi:MAG: hypothetical protein IJU29_07095 [Oscillospiraceae bacterium]|nr:hypothetical protein [Oscillospiraceae bacterium]